MDIDMHRVHVCTTENISVVLKMRLTKMEMQKRTNKKNQQQQQQSREEKKKNAPNRIHFALIDSCV